MQATCRLGLTACLVLMLTQKALHLLYITNKTEHFSFKSECVVQVVKCLNEDWFTV